MNASDVSPFHPRLAWLVCACFSPCLVSFASARDVLTSFFNDTALDDRQCFHARSASR